ncbi:MAG: hypothetical protein ACK452_07925, partial [Bacteroidota bacterium]
MAVNNLITIVDLLEKVSDIFSSNGKNKKSTSLMFTEEEQEVVSSLAARLKITSDQAVLFTAVFSITAFEREATTNDISHFLNCSTFQLFRLQKELNELCAKRMLLRERSDFSNISRYIVLPELFECILGDEIGAEGFIPEEKSLNEQFLDALQILFNDRQSKFISLRVFKKKLKKLSLLYPDVNVTKEAEKFSIFENDLIVYYDVYRNFLIDESCCDIDIITNRLLEGI